MQSGGGGTEAHYLSQVERLSNENRQLRKRIEATERENRDLKKSVYDLSIRLNVLLKKRQKDSVSSTFDLDAALSEQASSMFSPPQSAFTTDVHSSIVPSDGPSENDMTPSYTLSDKEFVSTAELKEHEGAVYTVAFSPCGRFLASGSFDRSIRIREVVSSTHTRSQQVLKDHHQLVSDISWTSNSKSLFSASYDHTIKYWDVDTGKNISTYTCDGLLQCVKVNPADNNLFLCATATKSVLLFDSRTPAPARTLKNEDAVSSLYVYKDGAAFISGDNKGVIKTWSMGEGAVMDIATHATEGMYPISHIEVSPSATPDNEGNLLTVNTYDNVLRVFERGSTMVGHMRLRSPLKVLHELSGHINNNFPIRSSMLYLSNYSPDDVLLLASGSADSLVCIWTIGDSTGNTVRQKLLGHTDRVYSVNFHPTEPLLATASADFSVRLWSLKQKKK